MKFLLSEDMSQAPASRELWNSGPVDVSVMTEMLCVCSVQYSSHWPCVALEPWKGGLCN